MFYDKMTIRILLGGKSMKEKSKNEIISWLKSIVIAFVLAIFIREFLFTPVVVSGQSMEPTFEHDNRIVITKLQ